MTAIHDNIFLGIQPPLGNNEVFESLLDAGSVHVERIISKGQTTPPGKWYDSTKNEWVVLLQGKATLEYENGKYNHLRKGDYVYIPAGKKHRVAYTSSEPYCIWLAIHFD